MNKATIDKLCALSMLSFDENQLPQVESTMSSIIDLMDTIKETDYTYDDMNDDNSIAFADLREDVSAPSMDTETLLKNARSSNGFFVVPKVIE